MTEPERERRERAKQRRASWSGEVVRAGTPKPNLYAGTTVEERLSAMTRLCHRLWRSSGRPLPERIPRSEWPGETFEIRS